MVVQGTTLTRMLGIEFPIIGGAMYPCSNPELVAAVSEAGGIGVVQPVSLTFVHGHEFRDGLRYIRSLTKKPIGLNLLIEGSSQKYREINQKWMDIALEEGVRFFITALGNPTWVVTRAAASGALVFHDATDKSFAQKAVDAGVNGLICVNNRAGGHAGATSAEKLFEDLAPLGLPLVCAGGIGDRNAFQKALAIGYQGVQIGTRFIATEECTAHADYKQAIVKATADDIVLTRKLTGVPVAVINTPYMRRRGAEIGGVAKLLLDHPRTKHLARMFYLLRSLSALKSSLKRGAEYKEFFQAGKSVEGIERIESVKAIVEAWTM